MPRLPRFNRIYELIKEHWGLLSLLLKWGPRYEALQARLRAHERRGGTLDGLASKQGLVVDFRDLALSKN
jgi:hypothetical protein